MKKFEIVKEKKDFDSIIHIGKQKKNKYYVIYNKESNFDFPRFGIAVGKKNGNAVVRNKLKRQIRMILTKNKNLFKNKQDYIIIVKRSLLELPFEKMEKELVNLIKE